MTSHESSHSGMQESIHKESSLSELPPLSEVAESSTPAVEGVIENGATVNKRVKLVGTNEGLPDYVELERDVKKIEKYQKAIRAVKERGVVELLSWFEKVNKFVSSLKENKKITDEMLDSIRMYHVLINSTPVGGKIESFDLPGGDIEKFIETELQKILEAQAQQDSADIDPQAVNPSA